MKMLSQLPMRVRNLRKYLTVRKELFFSEEILEPAGIQWKPFNKGTEVAKD